MILIKSDVLSVYERLSAAAAAREFKIQIAHTHTQGSLLPEFGIYSIRLLLMRRRVGAEAGKQSEQCTVGRLFAVQVKRVTNWPLTLRHQHGARRVAEEGLCPSPLAHSPARVPCVMAHC